MQPERVIRPKAWYRTMFKQIHQKSEGPTFPTSSVSEDPFSRGDWSVRANICHTLHAIPSNRSDPGPSKVPKPASVFSAKLEWDGALDGLNQLSPDIPLARPRASSTEVSLASELSRYQAELDSDIQALERRLSQKLPQTRRQPAQGEGDRSMDNGSTWRTGRVPGASPSTGANLPIGEDRGVSVNHSTIGPMAEQKTAISPVHRRSSPNTEDRSTEVPPKPSEKTAARTKFHFQAQSVRELPLQKGDVVYIHRQVDANWYQGEHHGQVGLFPVNYVEIIPQTEKPTPIKAPVVEVLEFGEAVALYNFNADLPMELPLRKGERICILRRVDDNWLEGKLPGSDRAGIFPSSYVQVTKMPDTKSLSYSPTSPPIMTPSHNSQLIPGQTSPNGTLTQPVSTPLSCIPSLAQPHTMSILNNEASNHMPVSFPGPASPTSMRGVLSNQGGAQSTSQICAGTEWDTDMVTSSPTLRSPSSAVRASDVESQIPCSPQLDFPSSAAQLICCNMSRPTRLELTEHGPTPVQGQPYEVIYNYTPQNPDELELWEGDSVRVVKKCDDGWFVGTSERTKAFGTFPGNYVLPQ